MDVTEDIRGRSLRITLEGLPPEELPSATVTTIGVKEDPSGRREIHETRPVQAQTTEIDLDPLLARLNVQPGLLLGDELVVRVDHPLHFSESTPVSLSSGEEHEGGRTVYEVSVRMAEVVYWPEFHLAVRDAHSGAHLEGVELRCAPTAFMGLLQQPGDGAPFTNIGTGLMSPVGIRGGRKAGESEGWAAGLALQRATGEALKPAELAQPEETGRGVMMYARAPGYAWSKLVVDLSKGGGREVLLQPEAILSVRLENLQVEAYEAIGKRATLFLRRIEPDAEETTVWSRNLDEPLGSEEARITALEPGEYAAVVELGESWRRKPIELGREATHVPAGKAGELLLVLPDPPEAPTLAALSGEVSFPSFGDEENVRLQIYGADYRYGDPDFELLLGDLQPVGAARPTWSFRIEELPVGRYQVRLMPFLKSWMINVPEGGRDDVQLLISELAEVHVETVDASTDQDLPLEAVAFRTLETLPHQVTHGGSMPWQPVETDGPPGRFRFWTAPGSIEIKAWGNTGGASLGRHPEEFELKPGQQSLSLRLAPACLIRFEFRVAGAALPHEDGIFVGLSRSIRAVGHDGRVGSLYPYNLVEASAPGLYEISFEGVGADRFLPIPPQRVELHSGETTVVTVELRRR